MTTTILLADDHALFRENLRDRLNCEEDLTVVATASTADEALVLAQELEPNVVVLDIDMPGVTSFSVAKEIRTRSESTQILFLSAFSKDLYIEEALDADAISYLTKHETPDVVIRAVRQAAKGFAYFSPMVQSRLIVDSENRVRLSSASATRTSSLTPREREVLRYLARGLSKKEIAATMHRSYSTIDKHAENLMAKLNIHDRVELARFAIREGLSEP